MFDPLSDPSDTPEQRQIRQTLRAFFEREAPISRIADLDATETYPAEILDGMAELGLWGIAIDEDHGGSPADARTRCIVIEEIQRAGACLAYAYVPTALFCAEAIGRFGTGDQQRAHLPALAAGRLRMAMALSEPDCGSDLMGLATRAIPDGDGFVIRGQKIFTTGADAADVILTLVRTTPGASPRRALTFVLIPRRDPRVAVQPLRKLAGQATHTCEVFFDDVRLGPEAIVGEVDAGAAIVMDLLDADRVYTAAQSLGTAQGAFDLARRYALERRQFGTEIINHQAVGHMLADMAIALEGARALTRLAADRLDAGLPCHAESAVAKIAASETATQCALHGMQILGGYSYMVEYGMERYHREAKVQEIFGGTNQILRNVLVRELGGGRSSPQAPASGAMTSPA
ncbi:acyl-CoA dehydrogenase family protein [Capillimicrobium parvum]|uniref:Acyl-CoA dehydrogenase n=1 Tax=Capillimicrobium parvum TaxID=2884022 RepID=A0A9E6XUS8_9ACTN|nr:acyl-CoA dehydrogenase family protein [Capillimicrobium parvum]UGS34850.1 Acyl-CoA dehydrogenase [Capillimicrobium parvum]